MNTRERYDNLDGLRTISCLCIIAMHIKANTDYNISGWVYNIFVPSWTLLVYLFIIISGFGMFCGYYEKFRDGTVDLNAFYFKRYKKIIPFFGLLISIDIVLEHSLSHLIEGVTEATLMFGLLPNNDLSVIGVGWTLGVIFLFYMLFPFFVFLFWNKKRSWATLVISIILNIFCNIYFFSDKFVVQSFSARHNFLYCMPYFAGGAISYLYRKEIKRFVGRNKWLSLGGVVMITVLYYTMIAPAIQKDDLCPWMLIVFLPWLAYAVSVESKILSNKIMKYLGGISLELYLAHMVIFRAIEKGKCLYLFGTGWISYAAVWSAVIIGVILFIEVYKRTKAIVVAKCAKIGIFRSGS